MKSLALILLGTLFLLQSYASELPNEQIVELNTPDTSTLNEQEETVAEAEPESAEDRERRWYREAVEARRQKEERKHLKKRIKKVMKLEYKANKAEKAWNAQYQGSEVDPLADCNTTCTRQCFTNDTYSTWSTKRTIIQCVLAHCHCFTVDPSEKEESLFSAELASLLDLQEEADEQLVIPENLSPSEEQETNEEEQPYNLVKDCDYHCGKKCLKLSSIVPFPVTTQCLEEKCQCRFSEAGAIHQTQALLEQTDKTRNKSSVGSMVVRFLMFLVIAGAFVFPYLNIPKSRVEEEEEEDQERKVEFLRTQGYQQL